MRQFLDPELLCKLLVALLDRIQNDALHPRISPLLLQLLDLLLFYLFCALCSLLESALVDAVAGPFVPAAGYLWGVDLGTELGLYLVSFFLLEVIEGFLFILGDK